MLEGDLVRLRAVDEGDLEPNYRWFNDVDVTRYLAAVYPISRAQEREWLARAAANGYAAGVHLAIETKDGVYIGNIGLHDVHPEHRAASLGVVIGEKAYWANGYGTDAVATVLRFGFAEMNLNRISLHVFEFNQRAVACYKKCGFQIEGRLRRHYYGEGRYWDVFVMGILRSEFDGRQER